MIALIVVAVATSCSDDPTPGTTTPDSGAQPGQLASSVCPDAAPEAGEGCVLPEGTTCAFDRCERSKIAQCTRGTWKLGGNPAPAPVCPPDFPTSGQTCSECFPPETACTYGSCDSADATANVSKAFCDKGKWSIEVVETCDAGPPTADSGPSDAGADVQRDADADVD